MDCDGGFVFNSFKLVSLLFDFGNQVLHLVKVNFLLYALFSVDNKLYADFFEFLHQGMKLGNNQPLLIKAL